MSDQITPQGASRDGGRAPHDDDDSMLSDEALESISGGCQTGGESWGPPTPTTTTAVPVPPTAPITF